MNRVKVHRLTGLCAVFSITLLLTTVSVCADSDRSIQVVRNVASLPLTFTENQGQWDSQVFFRATAGGATMWFTENGAVYQFTKEPAPNEAPVGITGDRLQPCASETYSRESITIKASFVGANSNPRVIGMERMEYKCNYFLGNDPNHWNTDVPNYRAIVYEGVYDGIDLKYYGDGHRMEYDFVCQPGADISQIAIEYAGVESLCVNADGELVIETEWNEITEAHPFVYQQCGSERREVSCVYHLTGENTFGFELGEEYDPNLLVTIDPVIEYSTYLGGEDEDESWAIAVDGAGCAYVTGHTKSIMFPTENPHQANHGGGNYDVFVSKLNSAGNGLVYSTYLGGGGDDYCYGISVGASGNAYVAGVTYSYDYPTENAYQEEEYDGMSDGFVTKLSGLGNSLVYSTYLGGHSHDGCFDVCVDGSENAYVTGYTYSPGFPAYPYHDHNGDEDVFVTKFSSQGSSLVYSRLIGGVDWEFGRGICVDDLGNAYVTGETGSTDYPTENPYQTDQAETDVFVTKVDASGTGLVYSTYLGGSGDDHGYDIAVDDEQNAYVTGHTASSDFPTENSFQADREYEDAFVAKLNSSGTALIYSTYIGGLGDDFGYGIAVDDSGSAYVTGYTWADDFPTEAPFQTDQGDNRPDVFVTRVSVSGSSLIYSTYLAGNYDDYGQDIAVGPSGDAYVTGYTYSTDFPTESPYQASVQGYWDVFVTRLTETGVVDDDDDGYTSDVDCDDSDPYAYPGAAPCDNPEACMRDADGDCYGDINVTGDVIPGTDCSDSDEAVNPDAIEIWYDAVDQDCDGLNDFDADLDTYVHEDYPGTSGGSAPYAGDCDDTDETINPGASEIPDDGIDQDCDGEDLVTACCGLYTGGTTGNANCSDDGKLTLSDISRMIDRVYISKTLLCCEASGNTNGDTECKITLSDISRLIDVVYISKTPPEACMPECEL